MTPFDQTVTLVVYVLALMRLTQLVNNDKISDPFRARLADRERNALMAYGEARAAGQKVRAEAMRVKRMRWNTVNYFVTCPWCVGMWLAFATAWVPLYVPENPVARYIALALAASHVVGLMARFVVTEKVTYEEDDGQ